MNINKDVFVSRICTDSLLFFCNHVKYLLHHVYRYRIKYYRATKFVSSWFSSFISSISEGRGLYGISSEESSGFVQTPTLILANSLPKVSLVCFVSVSCQKALIQKQKLYPGKKKSETKTMTLRWKGRTKRMKRKLPTVTMIQV